jgi:hypothetical protein
MAGNRAGNKAAGTSGHQKKNTSNGLRSPVYHIEEILISEQLSGIPHVFLSRKTFEIRMDRFTRFASLVERFRPAGIRADSHRSGGWYVYFPPDAIGRVNAGQCASWLNNLKVNPFRVKIKAQYVDRLGERAPPDSPIKSIDAPNMSADRPSKTINTLSTEKEGTIAGNSIESSSSPNSLPILYVLLRLPLENIQLTAI